MTPLLLPKCALNHFKRLMIEHFYERHLKCFSIKNVCTEFWKAFEIEFPSSSHRVSRYIVGSTADFPIFRSISMVLLVAVWVYAHCIDCIAFHNIVPHRLCNKHSWFRKPSITHHLIEFDIFSHFSQKLSILSYKMNFFRSSSTTKSVLARASTKLNLFRKY